MKRQIGYFIKKVTAAVLLLFVMLFLSTCDILADLLKDAAKEPTVSFRDAKLNNINFNGVEFLCAVNIENPNSFVIPFPDTNWVIFLNDISLVSFTTGKAGYQSNVIKANDSVDIDFTVSFGFLDILNLIKSFEGRETAAYKIELEILIHVSQLNTTIPFKTELEGEIPLLKFPRLSAQIPPSFDLDVSLSGIELITSFSFENPNGFPLPKPDINFDYRINQNSVAGGVMDSGELAPSKTTTINNTVRIDPARVGHALLTSMILGAKVNNAFSFSCDFHLPISGANILNRVIEF